MEHQISSWYCACCLLISVDLYLERDERVFPENLKFFINFACNYCLQKLHNHTQSCVAKKKKKYIYISIFNVELQCYLAPLEMFLVSAYLPFWLMFYNTEHTAKHSNTDQNQRRFPPTFFGVDTQYWKTDIE